MKKTIPIIALIFALLLTTGCAAANMGQEPMEAMHLDVLPAAENPTEEVVDEQTEAPIEKPTEAIIEKTAAAPVEKAAEKPSEPEKVPVDQQKAQATEPKATEPKPTEAAKTVIGKDKAKAIALDHAGVASSKASNVKVEYDKEDQEYEVDFRSGDYEYDYTIAAYSGKVLKHDKEYDPIEVKPKATEPKPTEAKAEHIGKEKAKSIALKHAGFSAGDVTGLQVEYDKDDGVPVYEVEFHKDRMEYSYEIHGTSGKILAYEIDD